MPPHSVSSRSPYEAGGHLTPFDTKSYGALEGGGSEHTGMMNDHRMAQISQTLATVSFPPWVMYSIMLICFSTMGGNHQYIAMVIAAVLFLFAGLLVTLKPKNGSSTYQWCGCLCFVAIINGIIAGLSGHAQFFGPYWKYNSSPTYTDVLPSEPAASRADAAIIGFNSRAVVDTFQTGSVRSADGTRFCVAPILDEATYEQNRAEFWAVGFDCCERHIGFYCDDARDMSAHSGLVVYDTDSPISPPVYQKFIAALNQSSARNTLNVPKEPVLLRWTKTPTDLRENFFWSGMMHILVGTLVALGASFLLGVVVLTIGGIR